MGSEYNAYRRVPKVPKVERVEHNDKTQTLDMKRKAKFEAALARAADEQRKDRQHERHHSYRDADERLTPAKKRP
jgi:hypothetical protein